MDMQVEHESPAKLQSTSNASEGYPPLGSIQYVPKERL